jgi:VIT1/CCC1 family predicted Fe2+/Mn2+ transporter
MQSNAAFRDLLEQFQRIEITEHHIYKLLARRVRAVENRRVLEQIAADELRHAQDWGAYTGKDIRPNRPVVWLYAILSRAFGFTFAVKLMEAGEAKAQGNYDRLSGKIPEIDKWIEDERAHEQALIEMLDEERLRYAGSVVLGLNDALVELTGALAGLTLAFQNTRLIALSGLITGIAAAMSMAASEYLSTRSEQSGKHPVRAAVYTGIAYILTVVVLILPYLLFENYFLDLALTLAAALTIVAIFNFYIAVAKGEPFRARFLEMAGLSFGVAGISFVVGYLIRRLLGIEV